MSLVLSLHQRLCIFLWKKIAHARNAFVDCKSKVVGGWPAVAVGYDLEGTIRFRTCPRFPARGDWLLMRRTSCPGVSESVHPSGDVDYGEQKRLRKWKWAAGEHMAIRYSVAWSCPWDKSPRVPSSYRLSIGESLIGLPSLCCRE
jgi:hypothetical protein